MALFTRPQSSRPWLLEPSAFREMLATSASQAIDFKTAAESWNSSATSSSNGETRSRVHLIPVNGVLMRQASFWSWLFDETAYEQLEKDVEAAVSDADVDAIVLLIDSPGGEVTGVAEFAKKLRALAEKKPIIAYGIGSICSAAYWIASACNEIIISPTSSVGSIGCVMEWSDAKVARERAGITDYQIVSSQSPDKRLDAATDEGRAALQKHVDSLAQIFIDAVADFRAVPAATVAQDFGKGGVFVGQEAVTAGLADHVGSLDEVISAYGTETLGALPDANGDDDMLKKFAKASAKATTKSAKISAKAKAEEDDQEAEDEEDQVAEDEDDTSAEDDQDDTSAEDEDDVAAEGDDDETSAEDEEEEAEDEEEAPASKKASSEQRRIGAILNSEHARGRSALAKHFALETRMSPKAAIAALKKAPQTGAVRPKSSANSDWTQAMRAQVNPKVGGGKASASSKNPEEAAIKALLEAGASLGVLAKQK